MSSDVMIWATYIIYLTNFIALKKLSKTIFASKKSDEAMATAVAFIFLLRGYQRNHSGCSTPTKNIMP